MRTLFLIVICVLGLLGCKRDAAVTSDTQLKLQLNWKAEPQFGGFYAADYAKHGLKVNVVEGGAGIATIQMVGSSSADFAIVSGDELVIANARGNAVVPIFAVYQTNPQGIMTPASRGLSDIKQVFERPGTLAMERGLPYASFLEDKYGFGKLKLVPSAFGDLTQMRAQSDYAMQCFITSEPLAAKANGIDVTTFLIADSGWNPYTTVLCCSKAFYEKNPDAVKRMRDAVREGWTAYLANPSSTNATMMAKNPGMDAATFEASALVQKPLIEVPGVEVGRMKRERWTMLTTQLVELKVIETMPEIVEVK